MTDSMKIFNKSLAGSIIFFFTSLAILYIFLPETGWLALVVAFLVTVIEVLPLSINDNILISLSTGTILYFIFEIIY